MSIIGVTNTVSGNEKAMGLVEINELTPDKGALHRYQKIRVVRGGHLADFRKDMGLAKNFKGVSQLNIPSLMEHTVDELMDLANHLRGETNIDLKDWLELDKMNLV